MNPPPAVTLTIFALTYIAIAIGKVPILRLDRAGAAFIGAVAMVVAGSLSQHDAINAIDFRTLGLLFGMMIVVANLRISGAFALAARSVLGRARSGYALLAMTVVLGGVLAAFFINDVVCLALTPLLIDTAQLLELDPAPFLIALATSSNIGSVATITGNPQNMIVAGFAHLRYAPFLVRLVPAAAAGLIINYVVITIVYHARLGRARVSGRRPRDPHIVMTLLIKSVIVAIATLVLFILGFPVQLVALGAGAALLLTRRIRPERVYALVDWTTLLLFAGLFVVVGGLQLTGLPAEAVRIIGIERLSNTAILAAVVAALSNLVSNVPAVLLFKPIYPMIGGDFHAALVLASASTLAGNLTVLGSIANLIVVEEARRREIAISFADYVKVGIPVTILTLAVDVVLLAYHV